MEVPLNLKVSPLGGVNITSLWQSMLAKFSANQSISSMTSKSVISTTFKSTWMVCPAITTCPSFTLFFVTKSTLAGVPTDNACIKGSTTNPACLTNGKATKELVEPESKNVNAKCPSIESVPVTTVLDVPASLLVITYALVCGRVCMVGS